MAKLREDAGHLMAEVQRADQALIWTLATLEPEGEIDRTRALGEGGRRCLAAGGE
jgi:hypothetical protein